MQQRQSVTEPLGAASGELDLSWLTSALAVGAWLPPGTEPQLAALGVRRVVDVRSESCDDLVLLGRHGIELLHLPTPDLCACTLEALDRGVAWVNSQLDAGHRVYVHCQHGIGRSALVSLCVLVSRGAEPLEALALAKRVRQKVSPSPPQLEGYRAWLERWRAQTPVHWRTPPLDALTALAYAASPPDALLW